MASSRTIPKTGRAIVIGGGIAGMLAANVLADHFAQVTIVERDQLPTEPESRKGVPQARHVHAMLLKGKLLLDQRFPGFNEDLEANGAEEMDLLGDGVGHTQYGQFVRFKSGIRIYTCSRDLIEHLIRKRLRHNSRLQLCDEREVDGLLATGDYTQVIGICTRGRGANQGKEEELYADLIVDASGRESHAPDWLEALGYKRPDETVVNAFLGYATRWYRRPRGLELNWKAMMVRNNPLTKRGGLIYPVEGERWAVMLNGYERNYPPADEEGFMAFARSLPVREFAEALQAAEPISPIYSYRRTESRWRHYERLARWPRGFIVLGDAVCALNPVYGQGMTAAALAAEALDDQLKARWGKPGMARSFQRALARVNRLPWLMATGEDFRYAATEGVRPGPLSRPFQRYIGTVIELATHSPAISRTFIQVVHLSLPPTALFRAYIVTKVARKLFERWNESKSD